MAARSTTRRLSALTLLAALAAAAGPAALSPRAASAQETEKLEQAKALFNMGAQLYAARKYVAAIQNFEEAYKLAPRPALLFSIAQAERRYYFESRQPDYLRRAITHYRAYLGQADQGGRRAEAGQALSELEMVASKVEPAAPSGTTSAAPPPPAAPAKPTLSVMATQVKGARIWVDGKQAEEGVFSEEVNPGKHTFKVSADGYFDEEREVVVQNTPLAFDVALKEKPATLAFVTDPGAQISIDGRLVGITPLPVAIDTSPGPHVITVTRNGYEAFSLEVDLERGESRTIQAPLRRTTQRTVAYGMLAASGVSLLAGGVFSVLALRSQSQAQDVLDERERSNISSKQLERYNDARDARDQLWRPMAIGAFGGAAAFGAIGALLYAFDQPAARSAGPRERSPRTPSPTPPPTGAPLDISAAPAFGPGWWTLSASGKF